MAPICSVFKWHSKTRSFGIPINFPPFKIWPSIKIPTVLGRQDLPKIIWQLRFSEGEFLVKKIYEFGGSLVWGICNFAVNLEPNSLLTPNFWLKISLRPRPFMHWVWEKLTLWCMEIVQPVHQSFLRFKLVTIFCCRINALVQNEITCSESNYFSTFSKFDITVGIQLTALQLPETSS